ncbi:MAG TPA: SprT family zinc-dependent metalloprotease [Gammaproteobacteria bacterium]
MHRLRYGDEVIAFERLPRTSSRQRILIKVHPDCRVQVRAPDSASDADVLQAVRKRAGWISKRLQEFRKASEFAATRRYVSGESHPYLGRNHLLKVLHAEDAETVKLLRGRFEVRARDRNAERVQKLLGDWYRSKAEDIFRQRLDALMQEVLWLREPPELGIRVMQTQWGSCSPKGRLTLNLHMVKAPRDCIDYVILHELCHLAEHNHSKRFYRLMKQVMPSWEEVKRLLDSRAAVILAT